MYNIYAIHISIIHKTIINGDKISTNMSRKSRIGIFSIVSVANNIEENSCRKSSVGSFSNISFGNDTEEDNLRGTYHNAKCHFLSPLWSYRVSHIEMGKVNFQKSNIGWPQQPPTERVSAISEMRPSRSLRPLRL